MDKFTIRKLDGYTIMPNKPLRDKSLSYGARGLLGFMLTLPEDWDYSFNGLVKVSKEGKAAVRTLINELKEAKYIKISQFRNEKGYYQYNYEVYEIPYDMFVKTANNPTPDFQTTDERNSDNQQQINTKRINTNQQIDKIDKNDKTKHKALINELVRLDYIKEDDEQILFYDSFFNKLIENGKSYIDIYSAIHYVVPKVISRNFIDEEGNEIKNKFGYLKTSIESNIRKFESYDEELYPEDDNSPFWNDYKFLDKEGR